jgi:hypothetical protein
VREKDIAAMLAQEDSHDPHAMTDGDAPFLHEGESFDDEMDVADEGQIVACEEIMQAFHDRDSKALLSALRSFVRMSN